MNSEENNIIKSRRFRCPCCGYYTLDSEGEFEICPVCFWEDDPLQKRKPDYEGGANELSLNESKENYKKYGACEERLVKHVRKPLPEEEMPEINIVGEEDNV